MRVLWSASLVVLTSSLAAPLCAQRGDRAGEKQVMLPDTCLLYTSDAADE